MFEEMEMFPFKKVEMTEEMDPPRASPEESEAVLQALKEMFNSKQSPMPMQKILLEVPRAWILLHEWIESKKTTSADTSAIVTGSVSRARLKVSVAKNELYEKLIFDLADAIYYLESGRHFLQCPTPKTPTSGRGSEDDTIPF